MTQGILEFHKIPPNPQPTDVKQPADAKQKNAEILGSSPRMTQKVKLGDDTRLRNFGRNFGRDCFGFSSRAMTEFSKPRNDAGNSKTPHKTHIQLLLAQSLHFFCVLCP